MNLVRVTAVDDGTPIFFNADGETPLIAAMRCLVKSHRGDFIDLDVPEGA